MDAANLYVSGYGVNTSVYRRFFCDAKPMGEAKGRSDLQRVFVERLREEMEAREISGNAIGREAQKRGLALRQASVSRILTYKQDPTLETVQAIADIIGLPAWYLLTGKEGEQRVIRTPAPPSKVVPLRQPDYKVMKRTKSESKSRSIMAKRRR